MYLIRGIDLLTADGSDGVQAELSKYEVTAGTSRDLCC
jgi:hypothetical protein